ncbi:MAG: hypothetical protein IJ545_02135 [Alphaproteobacteria bacterium]|nr:hypothetical protein [Alphaproteobacteria bacterium]
MSFWKQYTSPLGYVSNGNPIDTYGVDHSGFTTRDELQYQTARINRENELMKQYNNQGITDYPQYTTNFWGSSADNNYGFGTSNIESNIENRQQTMTPIPQMATQQSTPQVQQQPETSAWDTVKQWGNTAVNGIMSVPEQIWKAGESLGELTADTKIAYDYWKKMKQTGNRLVKTFGSGQGADIDNYYHPLLQCELAKISPESRRNGIALGYAKEYLMDYPVKRITGQSHDEVMKDSQKDLQNNLYGSNLGYYNPNTSCEDLLDDRRTPNMRKLGIK